MLLLYDTMIYILHLKEKSWLKKIGKWTDSLRTFGQASIGGVERASRTTEGQYQTYASIVTVLFAQLWESSCRSEVGGGALTPSFSPPILDALNCDSWTRKSDDYKNREKNQLYTIDVQIILFWGPLWLYAYSGIFELFLPNNSWQALLR